MPNVVDTSLCIIVGIFSKSPIFKFVFGEDVRKAVTKEVNAFDEEIIIDAVKSNIVLEEILMMFKFKSEF